MEMKIVTWNMNKRRDGRGWTYLREVLKPDIALLQEMPPTILQEHEQIISCARGARTTIYSRNWPIRAIEYQSRDPERAVIAAVSLPEGKDLLLASIHGRILNGVIIRQLFPLLAEIEQLIDGRTAIIGGDLNTARSMKITSPNHGHPKFWDHIDAQYVDCIWHKHHKEFQTFFGQGQVELQDDHLFVTKDLLSSLGPCSVVNKPEIRDLSDHFPVIAELRLPLP